ncbi:MAG: hypothetical protein CBC42_03420 [Betaproteobacteria bacterium TMED82]|nr:MAG: hypothetical protein CBC42_03420 [Betaproteobacteria bacterium TMED82]
MLKNFQLKISISQKSEYVEGIILEMIHNLLCNNPQLISISAGDFEGNLSPEVVTIEIITRDGFSENLAELLKKIKLSTKIVKTIEILESADWVKEYQQFYKPITIGEKLWIGASWHKPEVNKDCIRIFIDPSQAFGTGHHETTQLCLKSLLGKSFNNSDSLLDFGCGSGILGIYALKANCKSVDFVDCDEKALSIAKDNVIRNGFYLSKEHFSSKMVTRTKTYKFIYANIGLNTLKELVFLFFDLLEPQGSLVLSGLLKSHKKEIFDKYSGKNFFSFTKVNETEQNNWICMELKKNRESLCPRV